MDKNIKRGTKLRHFVWIFSLMILFMTGNAQTAFAKAQKDMPYLIKVNRVCNTITVYARDENGKYTAPIKAIVCSVGQKNTQTKLGTFQTKEKYRWKELMGKVYGQYSSIRFIIIKMVILPHLPHRNITILARRLPMAVFD